MIESFLPALQLGPLLAASIGSRPGYGPARRMAGEQMETVDYSDDMIGE
jgi:hypothetical protein